MRLFKMWFSSLYKTHSIRHVRILATDLQLIISFFLFSVSHIFSVIVATNSDSSSASQYRVFLYLTRKHIVNIFRYFWNGILISDYVSGRKIMKKNQVHFYRFWYKCDVLHRCTIVSICWDLTE